MGELIGIEPTFDYTPKAHTPLWPDRHSTCTRFWVTLPCTGVTGFVG